MSVVDDAARLRHIIDAARKACDFTKGKKRADLNRDEVLALALVRLLEMIGEAATGVSEGLRSRHPAIAWRQMSAMRNRLIHGYFKVDLDVVWDTIANELPSLIAEVQQVLDKETM